VKKGVVEGYCQLADPWPQYHELSLAGLVVAPPST